MTRFLLALLLLIPLAARAETPARLVVVGDSLARQYCRGFKRMDDDRPDFEVSCWVTPSSGLSRPDFHDWPADLDGKLSADGADIAVVAFGANDAQRIVAGGKALDVGSEAWVAEYRSRVAAVMARLDAAGAASLWVSLPAVRAGGFDRKLQILNRIYREEAARTGAGYFDLRARTLVNGAYTANLPNAKGRLRDARDNDGVHFTRYGENLVAGWIVDALPAR